MRILVIGSGGREHSLVWKISQSRLVDKVFCAPGNGGISEIAECIDISQTDLERLLDFVKKERIDLTVVGPEAALVRGIVDIFEREGLKIFGPDKKAARLEASKVFVKELMAKYNIPTASFKVFSDSKKAKDYIKEKGVPLVIKADGLAQGKGSIVCNTEEETELAIKSIMEDRIFGDSGTKIVVEECLEGEEASVIVITDGKSVIPLASSQDHKRIFDGDKGSNTGGMGAYSPTPLITKEVFKEIMERIIYPTIKGMDKEGLSYRGVLYAGIMVTKEGPKTLEFNVRYGDPENQVIMPRLKTDLVEVMLATLEKKLSRYKNLEWDKRSCLCVVISSRGYPGDYKTGYLISGLEEIKNLKDIIVFHAGTKRKDGEFLTSGGRVLGVTGLGEDIREAIDKTYQAVGKIHFEGMHFRRDIGKRALNEKKSYS